MIALHNAVPTRDGTIQHCAYRQTINEDRKQKNNLEKNVYSIEMCERIGEKTLKEVS